MKYLKISKLKYFFVMGLSISFLLAKGPGNINGQITDKKTGEPIPGVNIIVKGTYYGTAADDQGRFFIRSITAGVYDISVSMIGYKQVILAGINVLESETTSLDIELEETVLAAGEEVIVVGEKPILDVDNTSSSVEYSAEDIAGKVAESVADIISDEVGVVESDNEIHIRGGRVDESQFIVDGLSLKDPLTGSVNNLYVNPNAIEKLDFISGGFNAEYGQAMSGIIDVQLKEGSEEMEGSFRYNTDHLGGVMEGFNTDIMEFTLGGKEPISSKYLPGNFYYFFSGYMNISDTYLPHARELFPKENWMDNFVMRAENNWSWMSKFTWAPTPKHRLTFSQNNSLTIDGGTFKDEFEKILDNYLTVSKGSYVTNIIWKHTLSSKAYYNINFGKFLTFEHQAVRGKSYQEYNETLDLKPVNYTKYTEDGDVRILQGDEYWDSGDDPHYYDYYGDSWSFDFDISHQPNERHHYKAGFKGQYTDLQLVDIYKPWLGTSGLGQSWDMYRVFPISGAGYLQDRIIFEGMIINLGMRYDYWFPGKYIEDAVENKDLFTITEEGRKKFKEETNSLFGHRFKAHLSPRIGISHPVTDQDVLYFNYGHFSQLPTYSYVYAKLNSNSEATYNLIGNPNLNPKTTVAYELGIKHKFSEHNAIEFKAYYKDMFDYETSQSITTYNPKLGNYSFLMYINMDYARSRGLEMIYRQRMGRFFTGNINASYSIVTGKSSRPDDNLLVEAGRLSAKPLSENFLRWDRPVQISANLRFKVDESKPIKLFDVVPLPNKWGVNFHIDYQSGRRYTKSTIIDSVYSNGLLYLIGPSNDDKPYSELAKPNTTVDMKIYKDLFERGDFSARLFMDVKNLFNIKIPRYINPYTGDPYDPGQPVAYSYIDKPNPNYDPSRYYSSRNIRLGISCQF
ncbi:MAG: TonB-dependent receptor [Candidatus Marinimicrobia bacterium]|nr:TonB-dependent receptor [Candidatus Neomarinimicrobiota bacterium]